MPAIAVLSHAMLTSTKASSVLVEIVYSPLALAAASSMSTQE